MVELENRLAVWTAPVNTPPSFEPAPGAVLLPSLYFNVPPNQRLLSYWDTVTDRLSKVRAGENLAGQAITTPAYPGVGNPGEPHPGREHGRHRGGGVGPPGIPVPYPDS